MGGGTRMNRFLFGLVLALSTPSLLTKVDEYNVPVAVQECLKSEKTNDLELTDRMNPFFLRGDFDGDHKLDYAVLVIQRTSGKQGIAMCLANDHSPTVIGAGRMFTFEAGRRFDDLKSFDAWKLDDDTPDTTPGTKPSPIERIHLIAKERGSGLIYWDGKTFRWEQLGI
jgi:hypothetical protein